MKTEEQDCVQVVYPPTPEEIAAAVKKDDPNQARVRRPITEPPTPPDPLADIKAPGVDLTAYTYRIPEAGVAAGGLYGRWYVSLSETGSRPDRIVRGVPLRLSSCEWPNEIKPLLRNSPIRATIRTSGSVENGQRAATGWLLESMSYAVGRNPHWSPMCNGHFTVESASVVVGCTVPEIAVATDGMRSIYESQRDPLWSAGVEVMNWMFTGTRFRPDDLWRQVDWTLTPKMESISGSWEFWPWAYRFPEIGSVDKVGTPSTEYHAYIADVDQLVSASYQPFGTIPNETGTGFLGSIGDRLRGFILLSNEIRNRINADSNVIRGLNGIGQQPRYRIEFFTPSPSFPAFGEAGGGPMFTGIGPNGEVIYTSRQK
jgi:hypothetical protein